MEKRVPLNSIQDADKIVHHEGERKTITQLIKIVAYRSESCLASIVEPFFFFTSMKFVPFSKPRSAYPVTLSRITNAMNCGCVSTGWLITDRNKLSPRFANT